MNMTQQDNDNVLQAAMELLNENGFEAYAQVLRILLDQAMKIEREQALNAGHYERTEARKGYAMIRIKSAIGTVFAAAYKSLIVNSEGFFLISVSHLCIP